MSSSGVVPGAGPVTTVDGQAGNVKTVVTHGSDATVARPANATHVLWIGTVQPNNWASGDEWIDNS